MRSDIARRFAGVSRCVPARRFGAGALRLIGAITLVSLANASDVVATDGFLSIVLSAAGGGAISMPNISDRLSLASTLVQLVASTEALQCG